MSESWSAEFVISADLARSLIEAQFPAFAPARVELLGAGWDNTVFRVNKTHVFRFPRRELAVGGLLAEARVLPAIAARLPLAVPQPRCVGHSADGYPWPFAGYAMLPGRTAAAAALNDEQRAAAVPVLAHFLVVLHGIPAAEAAAYGAGPDTFARLDLSCWIRWARDFFDHLLACRVVEDIRSFTAILDSAPAAYVAQTGTLVHGDLGASNFLVNAENQVTGVIDWGDVHLGDPAVDLAFVHTFFPPAQHESFRRAYGPISDAVWRIARLRGLWQTAMMLAYAHDIKNIALLSEGRRALRYLVSD